MIIVHGRVAGLHQYVLPITPADSNPLPTGGNVPVEYLQPRTQGLDQRLRLTVAALLPIPAATPLTQHLARREPRNPLTTRTEDRKLAVVTDDEQAIPRP